MAAYEYREHPELSWSPSRQQKLDDCPRSYFYTYYLSHNGWLDDADPDARVAYRLKALTGFDALFGSEIDKRARELEGAARSGKALPTVDEMERRSRDSLNLAWKTSKSQVPQFERRPKSVEMLRSVYLHQDATAEIERVASRIRPCLEALRARPHWARLGESGEKGRVEIPGFDPFQLDGIKVYALPDLVYVHDDTLYVVDWKTGKRKAFHSTQVLLSSLWASTKLPGQRSLPISGHLEYLLEREDVIVTIPEDLDAAAVSLVKDGLAKMCALLSDTEKNALLDMDAFTKNESGLCATCSFLPLCHQYN